MENLAQTTNGIISSEALLAHWQGHRNVTRRVIEAFPEEQLFSYSIGGMRTFFALAMEIMDLSAKIVNGVLSTSWEFTEALAPLFEEPAIKSKVGVLKAWDAVTLEINRLWPQITPEQFETVTKAFGQWEGSGLDLLLYTIDNEIHHRAQGTVYLRSLSIEPPAFYNRG